MKYFNKFPLVEYSGNLVRNIMSRVSISKLSSSLLDYDMKDHDNRTDIISDKYYDSFEYDWLVNLSNQNVDPYYDCGLTSSNFNEYLKKKYGSVDKSAVIILFWKNDWESDDSILTVTQYETLPISRKKYFQEIIGYDGLTSGYERKKENWLANTNKIISIEVLNAASFAVKQTVTQGSASGTIVGIEGKVLYLKNIQGTFAQTSLNTIGVVSVKTLSNTISDAEITYWTPITAYHYEDLLNTSKRKIKLLDNRLVYQAEKEIERLLNE